MHCLRSGGRLVRACWRSGSAAHFRASFTSGGDLSRRHFSTTATSTSTAMAPLASAELRVLAAHFDAHPEQVHLLVQQLPAPTRRAIGVRGAATDLEASASTADANADGVISANEFLVWMRTATAVEHSMHKAQQVERAAQQTSDHYLFTVDVPAADSTSSQAPTSTPTSSMPTSRQLLYFSLSIGIPFVGFGFMDNTLMILAGDYIDFHVGHALGLSVLASAGLGNIISDCAGVGLGDLVESQAARLLGLPPHGLTSAQHRLAVTRVCASVAGMVGVAIGCCLGMFPLLLITAKEDRE